MGAWNTVKNYIDRTLEMVNFGDKSLNMLVEKLLLPRTGNLNKHLAQQKEILEKILGIKWQKKLQFQPWESVTEATVSKWLKSQEKSYS